MRVWIDTTSGTWGEVDGLRVVDLDQVASVDTTGSPTFDADSLVAFLAGASDQEIAEFGRRNGSPV